MRTYLTNTILLALWLLVATAFFSAACSGEGRNANTPAGNAATTAPTPSNKITAADVAKLKWIEGTWKGEGDENPFYERYRFEGTTMVVESLGEDGKVKTDGDTTRFELNANGEFGPAGAPEGSRAGASAITDTYVQFVPYPGSKSNSYSFERNRDNQPGWTATLEWPATADKPARQKNYVMKPWNPPAKQ